MTGSRPGTRSAALLKGLPCSLASQNPATMIARCSSAACFHRDTAYPSADCAAASASAESAKAYPELVSSGKTTIRAPASAALPKSSRLSSTFASTSPRRGENWQHVIVVMPGTVVSQTTYTHPFTRMDSTRMRYSKSSPTFDARKPNLRGINTHKCTDKYSNYGH